MIGNFIKKIIGSRNSRIIKDYKVIVKAINDLEKKYKNISDSELKSLTASLRDQ